MTEPDTSVAEVTESDLDELDESMFGAIPGQDTTVTEGEDEFGPIVTREARL